MENFVYEYPTKVYFGKGAAGQHLPGILAAYGPNVLLAYGSGSIKKNGVYEEITGILKAAGKTVTEFTGIMSNPTFAKAAGISVDKTRLLSVVLSTWLGAVGILLYEQGFGFVQIYMAPLNMAFPAVAAILIGGASVNKASITNVIIGTILYQGLVTMTPTVMNAIVHLDISEVIRIIVSNGMIVYALTRKTEGGK